MWYARKTVTAVRKRTRRVVNIYFFFFVIARTLGVTRMLSTRSICHGITHVIFIICISQPVPTSGSVSPDTQSTYHLRPLWRFFFFLFSKRVNYLYLRISLAVRLSNSDYKNIEMSS